MGNKSIFSILFLTGGTVLLVGMLAIVAFNFSRDARILKKPLLTIVNGEGAVKSTNPEKTKDDGYRTLKIDSNSSGSSSNSTGKKKTTAGNKTEKTKVSIELIDYTGIPGALEEASERLKASGYEVTGKSQGKQDTGTLIIIRKEDAPGEAVKDMLKTGRVVKWPDDKSQYDITIKLGLDYSP